MKTVCKSLFLLLLVAGCGDRPLPGDLTTPSSMDGGRPDGESTDGPLRRDGAAHAPDAGASCGTIVRCALACGQDFLCAAGCCTKGDLATCEAATQLALCGFLQCSSSLNQPLMLLQCLGQSCGQQLQACPLFP
jgi:hypothetical protein